MRYASAIELAEGLQSGEWTSCEVIDWHLQRIDRFNGPFEKYEANDGLNAFIRTVPELALAACSQVDRAAHGRARRNGSPWAGIPVALKDIFDVESMPATGGTPAHRSYRAARDCAVWRTWREAGAISLGQTQCQRFLTGLTTPQTANPWNPRLIAGGSSGGSAAAVASGMVPVALGSETDGSLIYPAACCGVTTLKPSHGLLSLDGVYPGLPSFDVVGPLSRTVADCAWVLATLARANVQESAAGLTEAPEISWPDVGRGGSRDKRSVGARPFAGLRFLVSSNERYSNLRTREVGTVDPRVQRAFDAFLESLEALGAEVVVAPISHDLGRYGWFRKAQDERMGGLSAFDVLKAHDNVTAHFPGLYRRLERASDAERDIAVKFYRGTGKRLESEGSLERASRITPERLAVAREKREEFRRSWEGVLAQHRCDAHIYLEIGSVLPERKGLEDTPVPDASREGVVPCDLGWPVLSLPIGRATGLDAPISAQIMARRWQDHRLLAWGMAWQRQHPDTVFTPPDPPVAAAG